MTRARLGAYSVRQLVDYLRDRGIATTLITLLMGYLAVAPARAVLRAQRVSPMAVMKYGNETAARVAMAHDLSAELLSRMLGAIVFLGALFAVNGIVSNDRKLGYYRFLFSKPMTPEHYYGQAFGVHTAGWLLLMTALGAVYGAALVPILTPSFLVGLSAVYLCYAGIGFLLSAAARWDWLSLVFVTVATQLLRDRFGQSTNPLAKLLELLPPLHTTNDVYRAVAEGVALPWHSVAWLGAYGAVCFAGGLLVLRYRRLAII